MKIRLFVAVLAAVCAFGASAEGDWKTTLGKVADLSGDTGLAGFAKREAPAYITGNWDEAEHPHKPSAGARAAGVIMAKIMNLFCRKENRINPLIGSAGVSAVPMAARVSNKVALAEDPTNYVLMQAMGPNVSGVIGSAVVAGVLYTLCR